jgi:thiamine pyrophosphate-dependent acetolactate synthase large subunit-like protein
MMDDQAYGNIRQEEFYKFGDGIKPVGVEFLDCDYCAVARALGCLGYRAKSASDIASIIENYRESGSGQPCFIEIKINGDISIWPELDLAQTLDTGKYEGEGSIR